MLNVVLHEPEQPGNTGTIGRSCVCSGTNYETFMEKHPGARVWYVTTKARQSYTDVAYHDGDFLMFGKESAGIPEEILVNHPEFCVRIPMMPGERSLNLSNSVSIVLFEALRQLGFPGMQTEGNLHRLSWE